MLVVGVDFEQFYVSHREYSSHLYGGYENYYRHDHDDDGFAAASSVYRRRRHQFNVSICGTPKILKIKRIMVAVPDAVLEFAPVFAGVNRSYGDRFQVGAVAIDQSQPAMTSPVDQSRPVDISQQNASLHSGGQY